MSASQEQGDSGRRRHEILRGQRHHLAEITHGALAAIVLPVGVGGEADGGVERQIGGDRRLLGWIERQQMLEPQQRIHSQESGRVEQQHRNRVGQPMLLASVVNARPAIEKHLNWPQYWRQPSLSAFKDRGHVAAERDSQRGENREIECDLNPAVDGHGETSEALGPQQRIGEIDQQPRGHDPGRRRRRRQRRARKSSRR
jgi:hypothetical protein